MSLQCPGCTADIDDDSYYCDQCGAELMKCGLCGYTGKGKMCPHDRTPLLPAKALAGTAGSTSSLGKSPATPGAAVPSALASASATVPATGPAVVAASPAPVPRALVLRVLAHGVELRPTPGDVLGRRFGPHAGVLARFSQISSNHLELQRDASGQWTGSDLNSFNHSFYNGRQLAPGQAQVLEAGATLSLGDVAFTVSLE
ncbi:FHA domain-containing protein [Paucibacter sp. AS339]|uniref:FHA domain-containing protein n=1 Tax=Paucibacter hankyongi TaxID=3133434 RepID=UPI0030B15054